MVGSLITKLCAKADWFIPVVDLYQSSKTENIKSLPKKTGINFHTVRLLRRAHLSRFLGRAYSRLTFPHTHKKNSKKSNFDFFKYQITKYRYLISRVRKLRWVLCFFSIRLLSVLQTGLHFLLLLKLLGFDHMAAVLEAVDALMRNIKTFLD